MAADWPDTVVKVILLDIAPTYDLIEKTDAQMAFTFWHWFFLPQPYPFPETMSESQSLDALSWRLCMW